MNLSVLCKEAGFSEAFVLPVSPYTDWTRHRNDGAFHTNADFIRDDPAAAYPWANACLICVWAYTPFDDPSVVPAYYIESNRAYHAMKALLQKLNNNGIRAERAETPYRTQLLQAGIGTRMDNQLWYYAPYGTFTVLWGAMLALPEPVSYTPPHNNEPVCDHCGRCEKVCFGALHEGTFDWRHCIRAYMENQPLPNEYLPKLSAFSGCERCQFACPQNPIERIPVPDEIRLALDPVEIVKGNSKAALALLGKNRKKPLLRQAIVLCANRKRTEALPYLFAWKEKDDGTLETELNYAISVLQFEQNMVQ